MLRHSLHRRDSKFYQHRRRDENASEHRHTAAFRQLRSDLTCQLIHRYGNGPQRGLADPYTGSEAAETSQGRYEEALILWLILLKMKI